VMTKLFKITLSGKRANFMENQVYKLRRRYRVLVL
jgi:hypothetical protein